MTTATPRVRPNLRAPRLGAPARNSGLSGRRRGTFVGRTSPFVSYRPGACWDYGWGWNNNWCANNWGLGGGWGYSPFGAGWATRWSLCSWGWGGFSPWAWNVGVLAPYYAWHTTYWDNCYRSAYWNTWAAPSAALSNYWWYPNTTYCPTYLYVPSSVVVAENTPAATTTETVIVAGGDVDGSAAGEVASSASDGAIAAPARAVGSAERELMQLAKKYVELGDFYFQATRYEAAAEAYAKARNYMPEDASVHLVLADAVFANGDYHYAAFLVAEAVRLQPQIVTAETDKLDFYSDERDFQAQLDALQRYCDDKPYDAWAQLVLGYNLRFTDQSARAADAFRRVLTLDRDNPTARAFLADLERSEPEGEGRR